MSSVQLSCQAFLTDSSVNLLLLFNCCMCIMDTEFTVMFKSGTFVSGLNKNITHHRKYTSVYFLGKAAPALARYNTLFYLLSFLS